MNNNAVFEVEAETEAVVRTMTRSSHQGHDMVQAIAGGFEGQSTSTSERTPLLAKSHPVSSTSSVESEDDPNTSFTQHKWDGTHDFDGLPWYKTPSVFWLLPVFLLYTIAFGSTIVPRVNLILSLICRNFCAERSMKDPRLHVLPVMIGGDNAQCQIPEVQALVAKFSLYTTLVTGILSALTSPRLGALSDRFGRTRTLCACSMGALVGEVIIIVVATNPDTVSFNWILLGSFFDGLGGSFTAASAISNAFVSDCTPPDRRNVAFGYIMGCLFFGIALGPLFAGYVIKATGDVLSIFYMALTVHCIFLFWMAFIVPESLTKERQQMARKKFRETSPLASVVVPETNFQTLFSALRELFLIANPLAPLSVLWPTEPGTNPAVRWNLAFLAAVDTTMFGVAMGAMTITLIYSEFAFGWGNFETSVYVSITSGARVAILIVVLPLVIRLLRGPASTRIQRASGCDNIDLGVIRLSIIFDLLGYVGFATVRMGSLFILSGLLAAIGGMGSPTLSAVITNHVPSNRTGEVLGAMGFLHAVARVVAPTIFNLIYAKTVGKYTPTVFICLAATFGLAFIFSLFIRPNVHWDDPYTEPLPTEDGSGGEVRGVNNQDDESQALIR